MAETIAFLLDLIRQDQTPSARQRARGAERALRALVAENNKPPA